VAATDIAEQALLARAREGDVRAYEKLVNQHQATAFRVALKALEGRAPDGAAPAEVEAIASSERAELIAAISRLGERDQLVIGARFFLELSEVETAAALEYVAARSSRASAVPWLDCERR
jgi:hypothetical protein